MKAWTLVAQLTTTADRDDRVLSLTLIQTDPWRWVIILVETSQSAAKSAAGGSVGEVLGNHAHEVLEAKSLPQAMTLAERYAKWWQGGRATHFDCDCDAIDEVASP